MSSDPLRELAATLAHRAATAPSHERGAQADRLRRHVEEYLAPRATDLTAPLVIAILGSTGSGKSSIFNALAGERLSPSGVLRPTTRRAVALAHPDDGAGRMATMLEREALDLRTKATARRSIILVDSPDFDSVEASNRALSTQLLEIADLLVFVTTATRYADQVPWDVLGRAQERGIPLLTVINRLPPDPDDAAAIIAHYRRLLGRSGISKLAALDELELVPIAEGALDPDLDAVSTDAVAPIARALDRLLESDATRRELARRGLAAAMTGLPPAVGEIADQVAEEQRSIADLRQAADAAYRERRAALADELGRGTFLRGEVVRQWQDFVGAGQVARLLSHGIGRITTAIRSLLEPAPAAPAAEVREAAFADLVALAVQHLDTAAHRAASAWAADGYGALALELDQQLWAASPQVRDRLRSDLENWAAEIGRAIRGLGERRKAWARVASIGVNAVGTSAILAVFLHTGGLTGAELGITAGTAVVNQKLLEAIFGEANVAAFVRRAREDLATLLDRAFADEQARFEAVLGTTGEETLPDRLRDAADRVAAMVPT